MPIRMKEISLTLALGAYVLEGEPDSERSDELPSIGIT
jgi:hypothetical protein